MSTIYSQLTPIRGLSTVIFLIAIYWLYIRLHRAWVLRKYRDSLKFPNSRSKFYEHEGQKIHYVVEGSGPMILLVHGVGANIYCWRYMIRNLSSNYTICAVDLLGFGKSDKPASGYSLSKQAKRLIGLLDHLGAKTFSLVGSSMGGAIAGEIAMMKPERTDNLILVSSAHDSRMVPMDIRFLKHLSHLTHTFTGPSSIKRILKRVYGPDHRFDDKVVYAYMEPYLSGKDAHKSLFASLETLTDPTLYKRLVETKVRTLIISCEKDKITPPKYARILHAELKGSILNIHPSAGHHIQEEDPEWLATHLRAFLSNA